jgi:hypothetical protein
MYIGHYKSVNTKEEFYSKPRGSLDFPMQVELSGVRYLLHSTYIASSPTQHNNIVDTAKKFNIKYDIEIK